VDSDLPKVVGDITYVTPFFCICTLDFKYLCEDEKVSSVGGRAASLA
jgi:hypothetical protein